MNVNVNRGIKDIRVKKVQKLLNEMNKYSEEMKEVSERELEEKRVDFKEGLNSKENRVDDLLGEGYGVIGEG